MTSEDQLDISAEATGTDRAVLTLAGRFDAVEAMRVRERLAAADLQEAHHLLVDLTAVTFGDRKSTRLNSSHPV